MPQQFTPQPSPMPPPQAAPLPGLGSKMTGLARGLVFVRALTGQAVVLAVIVFTFQAAMPEGRRPSDLIGGFHGNTEKAEIDAKREAQVKTARDLANAQAIAPKMAESLQNQSDTANMADGACQLGIFLDWAFGSNGDARQMANGLKQACGKGDQIRRDMTNSLTQAAPYPAR